MDKHKENFQVALLIIKCYFIILTFGLIFPKVIDIVIRRFIYKFTINKNSTFVFNFLNYNDILLSRYIYLANKFFDL